MTPKRKEYLEKNKERFAEQNRIRSRARYQAKREEILAKARDNYRDNIEYYKEKNRNYDRKAYILSTPERRKKQFINQARSRANKQGYDFNITPDDFDLPTHCPLLNVELDYSRSAGYNPYHASLDKINPSKGYTKGNVWIVSRKANVMKNDATKEELCLFFKNLVKLDLI